ncbi:MAG: 4,5-DOPA dioxygenase extradiol [Acidimicrobiales bacterium mtb01]|nr:4,5-DOPA dioxygenase extradiol [Actinomycetota bacterium]TEX46851.1 MAG: 4,5-DOPA dioxygenase extradiol [Acidimicrobiales bacterium mtb01]
MNALESNRFTNCWRELVAMRPVPRAIVAVSAHWYINATAVTAMEKPRTIHDFYGFPDELFAFEYPCPGSRAIAQEVVDALAPAWVGSDTDSWGIDHGTWSVLTHMFPAADVPVLQLSIDATKSFADHVGIGAGLSRLQDEGILVLGSGNVVHNLGRLAWDRPDDGYDWARSFDDAARAIMTGDPSSITNLVSHDAFSLAVPTPDHFIPLLYIAGAAVASGRSASTLVEGCSMGSLSMTSYFVD